MALELLLERTTTVAHTEGLLNASRVPAHVNLDRVKSLVFAETFGHWQAQPGLCRAFVSVAGRDAGDINGVPVSLSDEAVQELLEQVRVARNDAGMMSLVFGANPQVSMVDYTEEVLSDAVEANVASDDGEFYFTIWW